MADHSQKWHDGTTSRNIRSSISKDGLAVLVNKLENLGGDMKKLKESVHAIQVGCQICEGPHLDKDCPLNEEVKQVEEASYGEFGRTTPFNENNGESFEENTNDQLPTKESNPGHFTLPCTISNFNFYAMANLGASVNVLPRNIFKYLELTNLSETKMLVEMADMRKKTPLGIVRDILVKIDKFLFPSDFVIIDQTPNSTVILGRPFLATVHAQISVFEKEISVGIGDERVEDSVWSKRYSKWCNENSHDKKPMPRDYTFKEWVKLNKGHLDISKSVRKDLFTSWVIDQFTKALDIDKNHLERCLDEYNWVFHKEIEQIADEYEIKIGEKGQVLEEIWTKCNEDYDPPVVHTETFKVTKYKFNNGCSFICVSGENNETLSLGRKNGSRFKKMIMEEMEEVLRNDEEDSNNET
ncbi:putative reverse transcriptase domain-containing protein [Tanacetum coccineum]|uniref:Reverse transcriptase domain-containing protein n=1 Tax=Tanacetum coccineum TaxID=301880 RepID=A0ABQ5HTC4_9ASTR